MLPKGMKRYITWALGALLLTGVMPAQAIEEPLVMSSAPTQSPALTRKLYTPLAHYLSKVLERPVVIEPAHNFIEYQVKMRLEKYDITFDGPHLTSWRMTNIGHRPIVRFPGEVRIAVVTKKDSTYSDLEQLRAVRVCAFASPNLLTMAFLREFPNPARQPFLVRVQGFKGLVDCLKEGRGDVAVIRDKMWGKMDHEGLRQIPVSDYSYPERTFSAGPRISDEELVKIREAILSEEGQKVTQPILTQFKKKNFIMADPLEYQDIDILLSQVWGFHTRKR